MARNVPDLMVLGDSFTDGNSLFPSKLDDAIVKLGYDADLIGFSKGGDSTATGLARLKTYFADLANEMPEMALVALGVNDALTRVPLTQVRANLEAIVDVFQARGVQVLVANIEPYYPLRLNTSKGWTDPADQAAFRAIFPAVASDNGTLLDPGFLNGLIDDLTVLKADQLHPNPTGADRMVANVIPEVQQLIQAEGAPPAYRVQAESMQLVNYAIENQGAASGGKGIKTFGTGQASFTFSGTAGVYDITVGYHDENDGRGSGRLLVDNAPVGGWTFDRDTATWLTRTFTAISLDPGDRITLVGVSNAGEYGRLDYAEIQLAVGEPAGGGGTTSGSTTGGGTTGGGGTTSGSTTGGSTTGGGTGTTAATRIEAESMALVNYTVESQGAASGGKGIKVTAGTGQASFTFSGTAGAYDITVGYHDEHDGRGSGRLLVDNVEVGSWSFDRDTSTWLTRTFTGVSLDPGDRITLVGVSNAGEYARLDYAEIRSGSGGGTSGGGTSGGGQTPPPTTTNARIEAEAMQLVNFTIESQGAASGGKGIKTTGTGQAAHTFSGAAGVYDLAVGYHDEHDGRGSGRLLIDGAVVGTWAFDRDTATWLRQVFADVHLDPGDVVTIETTRHSEEYGRVDYLDIWA
jgi:lysophospholipase L1-like esterase